MNILRTVLLTAVICSASASAVTISITNVTPNGSNSGGTGSGGGSLSTTFGSISSNLGLPTTTYTVSNVDLTSVGGTATESFTFSLSYSQTGGTGVQFNGFGNVSVTGGDNNQVSVGETLTVNISLVSSSFAGLSSTGFTSAWFGGLSAGEAATLQHGGSDITVTSAAQEYSVSGTSITLTPTAGAMNYQGFDAEFSAVPEPSAVLLGSLGVLTLLRRRR